MLCGRPKRGAKRHISSKVSVAELCISNGRQAIYRVCRRQTYRHKFIAGTNNQYSRLVRVCVLARCRRHRGAPSGRRRRLPPAPGGTVFILLYPIKRLTPTVFRSIIENNFIAIPLGVPSPAEIIPFEPAQGNACLGSKDTRCLAPARRPASGGFAMAPKR